MKTIIWTNIILAAGIFSGALSALGQESMAIGSEPPMTPQKFVTDAATGGMKEVFLGRLALEKSKNADVRHFAREMVRDHSKANAELKKIAISENLDVPPTNTFATDDPNWN